MYSSYDGSIIVVHEPNLFCGLFIYWTENYRAQTLNGLEQLIAIFFFSRPGPFQHQRQNQPIYTSRQNQPIVPGQNHIFVAMVKQNDATAPAKINNIMTKKAYFKEIKGNKNIELLNEYYDYRYKKSSYCI